MPDLSDLATQVVAGLIVLAVAVVAAALWARCTRPLDWMATGKAAIERRRRRIEDADHNQLVSWVLQRAEVLRVNVVIDVTSGPPNCVTVNLHPSGEKLVYAKPGMDPSDVVRQGFYDPRSFGKTWTGKPVSEKSDEELRTWLDEHADQLPTVKAKP